MNIIAGIVTYNPNIERLRKCLSAVCIQIHQVIIVDNGSENIEQIVKFIGDDVSVKILKNETNFGIAKALNQIFEYADSVNCDWVLTLDQDTIIPDNLIHEYKKYIDKSERCAVICSRIYDISSGRTWPQIPNNQLFIKVESCITSGSLNRVEAWKTIHGFDEYLFIDEVDNDFCFRLKKEKFEIYLLQDVVINHQIGNTVVRRIFGKDIYVRNHSAFRKYYIVRNMLYIGKKYEHKSYMGAIVHAIAFTIKTMLFEDNKLKKVYACVKGFYDGIFYR